MEIPMTTLQSDYDKYVSWSQLDPRPCLYQLDDQVVVFWNGILMPYNLALALAAEIIFQTAISYGVSDEIARDYEKILKSGIIPCNSAWWTQLRNRQAARDKYNYVKKLMIPHVSKLGAELKNRKHALLWFNKEQGIVNQKTQTIEKSEA